MIRLQITKYNEESILLEAISGIDNFGFGTFLCDIKPDEIKIDEFSKKALISSREKRGLSGMDIWEDNRIAWGAPNPKIIMPISEISKQKGSDRWLEEIICN